MMSAGRKAVQQGVRVKLHGEVDWEDLNAMTPAQIKAKNLFPKGFRPLPHVKHAVGGMVFPQTQIDEMMRLEKRNLERFDVAFDLPDHLAPEFPPPIYLTSRPDLGDVSQGKVVSIKNYYELFKGILTPVQMEGLRLLCMPFPQRSAYFDGDHVIAAKKGVNLPDRASQVAMMAQMQNLLDFPPAPKLDEFGKLRKEMATEQELLGQKLFFGKARCGECHPAPFYLDNQMHDLHLGRFYETEKVNSQYSIPDGPIKTFTLRGIKDSPPYHHDGRLLTLEDTVEFFNLVTDLDLKPEEKRALVAFMLCL